jgi:hypothetical protein
MNIITRPKKIAELYGVNDTVIQMVPQINGVYDRVRVHEYMKEYVKRMNLPTTHNISRLIECQEPVIQLVLKERRKAIKKYTAAFQTVNALLLKFNPTYLTIENIRYMFILTTSYGPKKGMIMDTVRMVMDHAYRQYIADIKKITLDALLEKEFDSDSVKLAKDTDLYKYYTWIVDEYSYFDITNKKNRMELLNRFDAIKKQLERQKLADNWLEKKSLPPKYRVEKYSAYIFGKIDFAKYKEDVTRFFAIEIEIPERKKAITTWVRRNIPKPCQYMITDELREFIYSGSMADIETVKDKMERILDDCLDDY